MSYIGHIVSAYISEYNLTKVFRKPSIELATPSGIKILVQDTFNKLNRLSFSVS